MNVKLLQLLISKLMKLSSFISSKQLESRSEHVHSCQTIALTNM